MANPIVPLTPEQVALNEQQTEHEGYIHRALVAVDIAANVLLGGREDETISTHLAVDAVDGKGVAKVVGTVGSEALDLLQPDHGARAAIGDETRAVMEDERVDKSGIV
jgi:hypothetical protein